MICTAHRMHAPAMFVATAILIGCAHEQASPPVLTTPEPTSVAQITSQVVPTEPQHGVSVSDEILRVCKISFNNLDTAPKFDFDKSDLRPGERDLLQQVARCVTTGPLHGRSLQLVGRADPRGEIEYNFALGESRAGSVSAYLGRLGLDATKLTTTSRGKLDATGTDEPTWQLDRRHGPSHVLVCDPCPLAVRRSEGEEGVPRSAMAPELL